MGYTTNYAGNLIRGKAPDGNWQQFEYDSAGRLVKIKTDAGTILEEYTYGASRQRLRKEANSQRTYYAWGGSSVLMEYFEETTALTWAKSYIYAGSRLLSTITNTAGTEVTEYHHPDRLGTRLITNPVGVTQVEQNTLPFGTSIDAETTGTSNQRFTSYDRSDSTGLDYAVNRTYNSGQSRFTQVDPIGMASASIGDPQSLNLFAYVQNNPIDFTDPSGLDGIEDMYDFWGSRLQDLPGFGTNWGSFTELALLQHGERVNNAFNGNGFNTNEEVQRALAGVIAVVNIRNRNNIPTDFRSLNITGTIYGFINSRNQFIENTAYTGRPAVCNPNPGGGCFGNQAIPDVSLELFTTVIGGVGVVRAGIRGIVNSVVSRMPAQVAKAMGSSLQITFRGHGFRHLAGLGLKQEVVEVAIKKEIEIIASRQLIRGDFSGKVNVAGNIIGFRGHILPNGTLNVGTYFIPW